MRIIAAPSPDGIRAAPRAKRKAALENALLGGFEHLKTNPPAAVLQVPRPTAARYGNAALQAQALGIAQGERCGPMLALAGSFARRATLTAPDHLGGPQQ